MYREENNTGRFITGLITGSVLGGIAALLFAPKSGKEFRQDISDKGNELYDDANKSSVLGEAQQVTSGTVDYDNIGVKGIGRGTSGWGFGRCSTRYNCKCDY